MSTEELLALWRAIGEVSTNPAIGLLLGTESKTERFHPIGLAALSTENFGSAIDQMARYKQLTCPEEILQEKDNEEWSIQFRWLLADEVERPVLNECCFAWVLSIARHGTGTRLSPLRVEFVQPRPHGKAIERHFGCPAVCGFPRNAIVFRASDAQRPFVTRNAELLAMLAPQFAMVGRRPVSFCCIAMRTRSTKFSSPFSCFSSSSDSTASKNHRAG